jgi:hypothetical protein
MGETRIPQRQRRIPSADSMQSKSVDRRLSGFVAVPSPQHHIGFPFLRRVPGRHLGTGLWDYTTVHVYREIDPRESRATRLVRYRLFLIEHTCKKYKFNVLKCKSIHINMYVICM